MRWRWSHGLSGCPTQPLVSCRHCAAAVWAHIYEKRKVQRLWVGAGAGLQPLDFSIFRPKASRYGRMLTARSQQLGGVAARAVAPSYGT